MRASTAILELLLLLMLPARAFGDLPTEIETLLQRLGDKQFKVREAASERLEKIGKPALEPLRDTIAKTKDAEVRRRAIKLLRSCSDLGQVAGTYSLGKGYTGHAVQIDSDGRYWLQGCFWLGLGKSREGTVRLAQGYLTLTPLHQAAAGSSPPEPATLFPIRWGDRTYLLSKGELLDFCNAVNLKTEPRSKPEGEFLLKAGDWEKKTVHMPAMPPGWAEMLLPKAVAAEIIELPDARTGKLNVGSHQGVRPGMILQSGKGKRYPYMVRVISVENGTCLVRELNELITPDLTKGDGVESQKTVQPENRDNLPPGHKR